MHVPSLFLTLSQVTNTTVASAASRLGENRLGGQGVSILDRAGLSQAAMPNFPGEGPGRWKDDLGENRWLLIPSSWVQT